MKDKCRNNIITLIFAHLLLIAYPLVSKTIHVRHGEHTHHGFSANTCFEHAEDPCPVCDFEFYRFIASNPLPEIVHLQAFHVYNTPVGRIFFCQIIDYFSLRAPPIA